MNKTSKILRFFLIAGVILALNLVGCDGDKHTHEYDETVWKSNATQHWHECIDEDGAQSALADHTFGAFSTTNADATNHWQMCTICSYKTAPAAHTPGDWIIDTHASTTAKGSRHKECEICTYKTETEDIPIIDANHQHDYTGAWKMDATNHWKECEAGDGEIGDKAAHTPGDAWVTATVATAFKAGSRYKECTVCKYKTATEAVAAKLVLAELGPTDKIDDAADGPHWRGWETKVYENKEAFAEAKYFVIETKVTLPDVGYEWGFGGLKIVLNSGVGNWQETIIAGDWNDYKPGGGELVSRMNKTIYVVIELSKLTGYTAIKTAIDNGTDIGWGLQIAVFHNDFIFTSTQQNNSKIGGSYINSYLTKEITKPAASTLIDLTLSGINFGYVTEANLDQ